MAARAHILRQERAVPDRKRRGVARFFASAVLKLAAVPFLAVSVAVSIYVRTSPYPRTEALIHLISMGGCPAAAFFGLSDMREGELGYHRRNDPDGDGVACALPDVMAGEPAGAGSEQRETRKAGGAKFVRP